MNPSQPQALEEARPSRRWTRDELDLIKHTVVPQGATDSEFKLLLYQSNRLGLDPLSRQIYLIKRYSDGKEHCTIQTGIDGFRTVAERTGRYQGQDGPYWCGEDGQWVDVWTAEDHPVAAKVGILRSDFARPVYAVALWSEYVQLTKERKPTRMWAKMGALMLGKCAEALALRKAFPQDLSGVYTTEEMAQADDEVDGASRGRGRRRSRAAAQDQAEQAPAAGGETIDTTADAPNRATLLKGLGEQIKRLHLTTAEAGEISLTLFRARSARDLRDDQVKAFTSILQGVPDGTDDVARAILRPAEDD